VLVARGGLDDPVAAEFIEGVLHIGGGRSLRVESPPDVVCETRVSSLKNQASACRGARWRSEIGSI
jgi:hypothetical protein